LLTCTFAGFIQDIAAEDEWVSNEKELNYPRAIDLYEQNTSNVILVFLYYLRHIVGLPYSTIKYVVFVMYHVNVMALTVLSIAGL
jgi:hypothetical protein